MKIVTRIKREALPIVDLSLFDAVGVSSASGEGSYMEVRPDRWAMKFYDASADVDDEVHVLIVEVEQPNDALAFMDVARKVDLMTAVRHQPSEQ